MLACEAFYECLIQNEVTWFCGVPDSLLKNLLLCIDDRCADQNHVIAANEGGAIALACGYHLATGKAGLVYMQNSGMGNAINPLTSLAAEEVFGIPMLLLVGWRGEPGVRDEPQHRKQGRITQDLLNTLEIPFQVLPKTRPESEAAVERACGWLSERSSPYALLVHKETFAPYQASAVVSPPAWPTREQAIGVVLDHLSRTDLVLSSTGKLSRELFEYRAAHQQSHDQDFMMVGSMGHLSQIAMALAACRPDRRIYCIDGDGAVIMHMGALGIIGALGPANLRHIVINNGAHDSVGGQKTVGLQIDLPSIAKACGYRWASRAGSLEEIGEKLEQLALVPGPALLEIRARVGARPDLGRPDVSPRDNKSRFMNRLKP